MMYLDGLTPHCQSMIQQGKIPYLLIGVRRKTDTGWGIDYQTKGKHPLKELLEKGGSKEIYRFARRIVYCYYDLESEYFIPGSYLCLEVEQIFVDKDDELYFKLDSVGHYQLYPIMRILLSDRWQKQILIPESRKEWMFLIEECEQKEKMTKRLIMAENEPEKSEQKGFMERFYEAKKDLVKDDKKLVLLWVGCFFIGVLLSLFS
ncbi:hypothetical protein JR334_09510 [Clostridia bacterium]|nr:hypothetical protein JR334_09510 [Clostridia bacterium]